MSQLPRRMQLPLLGALLLGLLVGVYMVVYRRLTKKSASSRSVARHTVKKTADDVLKYWTAGKMHDAKGVDLPEADIPDQEKQRPHKSGPQQH